MAHLSLFSAIYRYMAHIALYAPYIDIFGCLSLFRAVDGYMGHPSLRQPIGRYLPPGTKSPQKVLPIRRGPSERHGPVHPERRAPILPWDRWRPRRPTNFASFQDDEENKKPARKPEVPGGKPERVKLDRLEAGLPLPEVLQG